MTFFLKPDRAGTGRFEMKKAAPRRKAFQITIALLLSAALICALSGCAPEALEELFAAAAGMDGIRIRGLMAIPPAESSRAYFGPMYNLFVDNKAKKYDNVTMDFLSMGMSDDYEDAVRQGANMVRVGSLIFGPRNYI